MTRDREISPELLGVYASLIFAIGSLITLAASIISYRNSRNARVPESAEVAGAGVPLIIG